MTQIEREDLVARYLAGEMTPATEAEFFLHVAVDEELQRTLKAFRIMEQAIRNDRETAIPERSRYREHVMAMLVATPAAVTGGAAGAGAASTGGMSTGAVSTGAASAGMASAGAGGGAAAAGGAVAAGFAWKTAIVSIIAGGLAVGTAAVVLPEIIGGNDPAPTVREVTPGSIPQISEPQLREGNLPEENVSRQDAQEALPQRSAPADAEERNTQPRELRNAAGSTQVKEGSQRGGNAAQKSQQVREDAGVTPDAASRQQTKEEEKKDGGYIRLPNKSQDEVKISTEIESAGTKQP